MLLQPWILILFSFILRVIADDDDEVTCDADNKCPKSKPCCSQYGLCGTGNYCLGGCDIRYSYSLDSCMPMPMWDSYSATFENISIIEKQSKYLGKSDETDWVYTGYIDSSDDALLLQMPNDTTGTVVSSTKYVWYGRVKAKIKTSRDRGVVTAFIMFSDVQDEIDHESLGYDLTQPQSNYYAQGILNYDNQENTTVSNTYKNYHEYEVDWTEDSLQWIIDGDVIRTLNKTDTWNKTTHRYDYPQTPSRIQFSLWPGGYATNTEGVIEWAGGEIDWDSEDIQKYGYYYAFIKEVTVEQYDLPSWVSEKEDEDGGDDFTSFLYNSTDGDQENIYLTNKKTWLGSDDATGLDPDNDDDETETETVVETSGSTTKTSYKTSTYSKSSTSTTTTNNYNPSAGIGGFIQDSEATSSGSSDSDGSSSSSGSDGSTKSFSGIITLLMSVGLGLFWI